MSKENEFLKKLIEDKNTAESYVVMCIYKEPELMFDTKLTVDDIHNQTWKFFFSVAQKLVKNDKRKVLDDVTLGLFINTNNALKEMYEKLGGYQTIQNGVEFVQVDNFDSHVNDLVKYTILIKLLKAGFPVESSYDDFKSMSPEDIQAEYEAVISSAFSLMDTGDKMEDMSEGYEKVIEEADEGVTRGFPYASKLVQEVANGQMIGNITMLSANSGVGKTFLTLSQILPNTIQYEEPLVIMANEEDATKWKREILTYVVNNILGKEDGKEYEFKKTRFFVGNFTKEEKEALYKAVDWLHENLERGIIKFINFSSFSMDKAIRTIKRERDINDVRYFVLDTLKMDAIAKGGEQAWLHLQQNMVKMFDTIKPAGKNVHLFVTYQLGKGAKLSRFLDQNNLGVSKNVADVVSTLMLARKALETEKKGGRNELKIMHPTNPNISLLMDEDKDYMIVFFDKNRQGSTSKQVVLEVDMARNIVRDFGYCNVPQDI